MGGAYQGWNLEEKERELHLIMADQYEGTKMTDYSNGVGRNANRAEKANFEERAAQQVAIAEELRAKSTAPGDSYPRESGKLLDELEAVINTIDLFEARKRELCSQFNKLREYDYSRFDQLVNRPEPGEVAITRAERY